MSRDHDALAKMNARLLADRQNWKTEAERLRHELERTRRMLFDDQAEAERWKKAAEDHATVQFALSEKLNKQDAALHRLIDAFFGFEAAPFDAESRDDAWENLRNAVDTAQTIASVGEQPS